MIAVADTEAVDADYERAGTRALFPDLYPEPGKETQEEYSQTRWSREESGNAEEWTTEVVDELTKVRKSVRPFVSFNTIAPSKRQFEVLQQWEGIISEIGDDHVVAELINLRHRSNPIEIAEILLSEFPRADESLLAPGNAFYWTIGYDLSPGGQISTVSKIRMRRLPKWTKRGIEALMKEADAVFKEISGDEGTSAAAG